MKKPRKPNKPILTELPLEPQMFHVDIEYLSNPKDGYSILEYLNSSMPNTYTLKGVYLEVKGDIENPNIRFFHKKQEKNVEFVKQMEEYNILVAKNKEKLDLYKEKLNKYNIDMELYLKSLSF